MVFNMNQKLNDAIENMLREAVLNGSTVSHGWREEIYGIVKNMCAYYEKDAMRYRWLREQHWNDSEMCVVMYPKDSVKLGSDCPSLDRLDDKIEELMKL